MSCRLWWYATWEGLKLHCVTLLCAALFSAIHFLLLSNTEHRPHILTVHRCCLKERVSQVQALFLNVMLAVLNIGDIPVYRLRYRYLIQNDTTSVKFYWISFWTDMSWYITTWPIYRPISEMKISDAFEKLLQTHSRSFYKK